VDARPGRCARNLSRLGIGFVAYSPLSGSFTGEIRRPEDFAETDSRRMHPRFQGDNFQQNLDLVARIRDLAAAKRVKPSQLAIAWVLAQGDDIVPIPGTKRRSYLEENARALEIELSADDLHKIERAPKTLAGTRLARRR
jgi:aryl-alcohol dehydrogenase-like predicted oxidoreductase